MKGRGLILCALFALAGRAEAQHQYDPREPVVLDPGTAYVYYRTNVRGALVLLRETSAAERQTARAAAYARARANYERQFAAWERSQPRCRAAPAPDCPSRPVELTLSTFPDPAPDRELYVGIGWQPRFTQGDEGNSYFRSLPPGSYIILGNVMMGPRAAMGVCMCMGSLRFEARPGQIVDLGRIDYARDATPGRAPWGVSVTPYNPAMSLPARLAGLPRVAAEFHAAGKMPNHLGLEIDRHPPLAGVLRYERDRVIDDRTGQAPVPRP